MTKREKPVVKKAKARVETSRGSEESGKDRELAGNRTLGGRRASQFGKKFPLLAAALLAAAGAFGLYFFFIYDPGFDSVAIPLHRDWKHYENKHLGFGLDYPSAWAIEVQSADTVTFSSPQGMGEVTVSVTSPKTAELVRNSLSIERESEIYINGVKGTRISETAGAGRNPLQVILVTANGKLYYIAGSAAPFDQITETFKLIENN